MAKRALRLVSIAVGVAACCAALTAPEAFAQVRSIIITPEPPPTLEPIVRTRHFASDSNYAGPLDELVAALRSPKFETRDEAMTALLRLHPARLTDVRSLLTQEKDAEAASRLTQVAVHLYLKARTALDGQTSMMGISFYDEVVRLDTKRSDELRKSVVVMELKPGYPAAQELRIGDRLLAINGKKFPIDMPREAFPEMIRAHRPGEVVPLTIVRDGRELEVTVQLAGLPAAGVINLNDEINKRTLVAEAFIESLRKAQESKPLIIEDKTMVQRLQMQIED